MDRICLYCRVKMPDGSKAEQEMCPDKKNLERHTPWEYNPVTKRGMIIEMEPLADLPIHIEEF